MAGAAISELAEPAPACANCGATLTGSFCAQCGQKARVGPPTVSALARVALPVVYGVVALRNAYELRWWPAIWRSGAVLVAYFVWLIIAILLVAAVFLGWWATRLGQ